MDLAVRTIEQLRDHLRALRQTARLTQKGLGQRLGVGQVRVAEIEASPGSISAEQLLQVLQALDAELVIRTRPAAALVREETSAYDNGQARAVVPGPSNPNKGTW